MKNGIQQNLATFSPILGILNNNFKPTVVQKFSGIKLYNALAVSILSHGSKTDPQKK
jgi:hypothetical protein